MYLVIHITGSVSANGGHVILLIGIFIVASDQGQCLTIFDKSTSWNFLHLAYVCDGIVDKLDNSIISIVYSDTFHRTFYCLQIYDTAPSQKQHGSSSQRSEQLFTSTHDEFQSVVVYAMSRYMVDTFIIAQVVYYVNSQYCLRNKKSATLAVSPIYHYI